MPPGGSAPKERGYGRSVLVGSATLLSEIAVLSVISSQVSYAQEHPAGPGGGSAMAVLLLPGLVLACVAVTVCLALPSLAVAGAVRRESWQGVLLCAAGIAFVPCVPLAAWMGGGFLGFLVTWLVGALLLGTTALAGRRARRQRARRGAWRALGRTLAQGAMACVLTTMLGYGVYATEIVSPYAPPRVTDRQLQGTWSDGRSGTLRLAPDGSARAVSLSLPGGVSGAAAGSGSGVGPETDAGAGAGARADTGSCSGTGVWEFTRAPDPWEQTVTVTMERCAGDQEWHILGTAERPKLYLSEGDPDAPEITTLTRP
ncbi:hypothetical protein [Streptomyces axinellae]|uniref:Integral membrane protein n=1 Tax=Streptomyces axinellae TaxID=552788 RepID=A0ABP6CY21_9ACTN